MALTFNGTNIKGVTFNGTEVANVYFNGTKVWQAAPVGIYSWDNLSRILVGSDRVVFNTFLTCPSLSTSTGIGACDTGNGSVNLAGNKQNTNSSAYDWVQSDSDIKAMRITGENARTPGNGDVLDLQFWVVNGTDPLDSSTEIKVYLQGGLISTFTIQDLLDEGFTETQGTITTYYSNSGSSIPNQSETLREFQYFLDKVNATFNNPELVALVQGLGDVSGVDLSETDAVVIEVF